MTDRERLIKLLADVEKNPDITCPNPKNVGACRICKHKINDLFCDAISREADYLLDHRVIVPPCKVGDTVYSYCETFGVILPYFVEAVIIRYCDKNEIDYQYEANCHNSEADELLDDIDFEIDDIGKTVFLTLEEAEKALKGSETE